MRGEEAKRREKRSVNFMRWDGVKEEEKAGRRGKASGKP